MDRRAFITVAVESLIAAPFAARAQQIGNKRHIGILSLGQAESAGDSESSVELLRDLGWVEGQNLIVERRYASGKVELLQPMVEDLVRRKVEVIVANGTVASLAAKRATSSIPIVIERSGDPVGAGLVESLARPGANITGTSTMSPELEVKRLELLRELLPSAMRFGVLVNLRNPLFRSTRKNMEQASRALQMTPIFVEVSVASELESAVVNVAREGGKALIVNADPLFSTNFSLIARRTELLASAHDRATSAASQRRVGVIWPQCGSARSTACAHHRQGTEGRETSRSAHRAAHYVRSRDQPEVG
jgi:putative ABC transport system substrate-binding protein